MADVAPMPRASEQVATIVNAGSLPKIRSANFREGSMTFRAMVRAVSSARRLNPRIKSR